MNKKRKKIYEKTGGKCYYCGCDLPKRWHADHIKPIRRKSKMVKDTSDSPYSHKMVATGEAENPELDIAENKVPACPRCNIRKSSMDIETFRNEIAEQANRLLRDSNQFKLALDYGVVEITGHDVEFYFEQSENLK